VPSGYEDGTLGSLVPTDAGGDFTFSRGSNLSATRVNEQGFIEKGYENLLLQSNSFTTSPWEIQFGSHTLTSGQLGYDGTNDAWLIQKESSVNHYVKQSISVSGVNTFSFYAKNNTTNGAGGILIDSALGGAIFNLENGTIYVQSGINASIEPINNDWYRCSFTFNGSSTLLRFQVVSALGSDDVIGKSIYIQDAQLNQGLVAYPYIETTTAPEKGGILADLPRLDYSSGRASLLLEPQRTNLFAGSEYLTGWSNIGLSPEYNYGISPEGVKNSVKLTATGNAGNRIEEVVTLSAGVDYTFSMYIKNIDSILNIIYGTTDSLFYDINWNGAEILSVTAGLNYEPVGNGWYRIWETSQSDSSSIFRVYPSRTGPYDKSIEIYGLQLEEGSYPTSYIPTYGTSQTRLGDLCVNSGDVNTFNSAEGVFYFEGNAFVSDPSAESIISIYNSSGSEQISIRFNRLSANNIFVGIAGTTGTGGFIQNNSVNLTNTFKLALKYSVGNWKLYVNGNLLGTTNATTFSANTLNSLNFSSNISTIPLEGNVGQVLYFPTALSDEACIELTTL